MLYIVATPIGNLGDITYRAVEVLKACDYVLCEDTRWSRKLLDHYQIKKPLKSYHKFNEKKRTDELISELKRGLTIALVSDAGTPGIADPGQILVERCVQEKIPVTTLPGPCSGIAALTLSAFGTEKFQVVGFLPKKKGKLKKSLGEILEYPGTTVCFESPYRLLHTLKALHELDSTRRVCVVRELTKVYEECRQGTLEEQIAHFTASPPKGEIVLVIGPPPS